MHVRKDLREGILLDRRHPAVPEPWTHDDGDDGDDDGGDIDGTDR